MDACVQGRGVGRGRELLHFGLRTQGRCGEQDKGLVRKQVSGRRAAGSHVLTGAEAGTSTQECTKGASGNGQGLFCHSRAQHTCSHARAAGSTTHAQMPAWQGTSSPSVAIMMHAQLRACAPRTQAWTHTHTQSAHRILHMTACRKHTLCTMSLSEPNCTCTPPHSCLYMHTRECASVRTHMHTIKHMSAVHTHTHTHKCKQMYKPIPTHPSTPHPLEHARK